MSNPSSTHGLRVREHVRETVNLPVTLAICTEHVEQVQFTPTSNASSPHGVAGVAVDISSGGLGIECAQFLPRMTEGLIRVFAPRGKHPDPSLGEPLFEQRVKVRRVRMITHDPQYALGLSFVDPEPDLDERIRVAQELARTGSVGQAAEGGTNDG